MSTPQRPKRAAITERWHRYRRIQAATAVVFGTLAGLALEWPAMYLVAVFGVAIAVDSGLALKCSRSRTTPTIIGDILMTGIALVIVEVPGVAIGVVVAYFLLVVALLGESFNAWTIGLFAVIIGFLASVVPLLMGLHDHSVERTVVAGVVIVSVFGVSLIGIARDFAEVNRRGQRSIGRKIEVADAISAASQAIVASDDVGSMSRALDAIREAMHTAVVFLERNVDDPSEGLCAVVEERSAESAHVHSSFDRTATMPWSVMPCARSHLEGGAPFFYRVEEAQGTAFDRGGESGVQVEVDVPIVVNGRWAGVIGAADSDPDRAWRTDDLILLRTLADLTAALWEREAAVPYPYPGYETSHKPLGAH